MLVTDWPGKISGIIYKSGRCDDCDMFKLVQKRFVLRQVGRVPVVIWESWTAYSRWVIMISALITFSIHKLRSLLGSSEEDGALLITVMMQIQSFRNY